MVKSLLFKIPSQLTDKSWRLGGPNCDKGRGMSYLKNIADANASRPMFHGGIVEGASVRTPCGPRRVEMVRPGDLIVTRDNGLQPVLIAWSRRVSSAEMALSPELSPVRIKARALGPMLPQQDILVAQDQQVLVPGFRLQGKNDSEGRLVEAGVLAEASDSIYVDRARESVTYYTFVFEQQQVFTVNGMPADSFLPRKESIGLLNDVMREGLFQKFPKLKARPTSYKRSTYKSLRKIRLETLSA